MSGGCRGQRRRYSEVACGGTWGCTGDLTRYEGACTECVSKTTAACLGIDARCIYWYTGVRGESSGCVEFAGVPHTH